MIKRFKADGLSGTNKQARIIDNGAVNGVGTTVGAKVFAKMTSK